MAPFSLDNATVRQAGKRGDPDRDVKRGIAEAVG